MSNDQTIRTTREVQALRIPSGEQIQLPADTPVIITQALGGSFTLLIPTQAGLFRVNGEDADALGQTPIAATSTAGLTTESAVWKALKTCYDPEIPVNIVDLGLIYSCTVTPAEGGHDVAVKMTLTAPGCGMGPVLAREAEEKIGALEGVKTAGVEVVWEPPWSPDRITPEGRQKLGMD
jgi:probable FeS assembly SUF system protein SufT